jgi:hypothetical protein
MCMFMQRHQRTSCGKVFINPRDLYINTSVSLQGILLDTLLQRIIQCKVEMRKAMLSGYMQALDESEGLQQTISRLADRMGMGEHPYLPLCPPAWRQDPVVQIFRNLQEHLTSPDDLHIAVGPVASPAEGPIRPMCTSTSC